MFVSRNIGLLLSAVVIILCLSELVKSQTDETVREGTFGRDVTEAVLRRIEASTIFTKDHSFLTRLAYVESKFGTANNTFRDEYFGGIWQVEEAVFRVTQTNHSTLVPLHLAIRNRFGINWHTLKWSNLVVPLYSGLAAALYFSRVPEPIPDTISKQADHWIKYYRPLGEVSKFIEDSEDLRNQTQCRGKMDLCIVLDSSGSINQWNPGNYARAKEFTAKMIESFTLDYNRIGMLIFSTNVRDIFPIRNNHSIAEMARLARAAPYLNAGTRTDRAILRAVELFQATPITDGVPRLLFVFTDGNSDFGSNMNGAVQQIENAGLISIGVGIGNSINEQELRLIALDDPDRVFMLTDFEALQDFLFEITSVACETPQRPALNGTTNDTVVRDEKRLYELELPQEGITIEVKEQVGRTNGYWSWTEKVPSSAIHDGRIDGPTFIPPPPGFTFFEDETNDTETTPTPPEPVSVYITIQGVEDTNNYTLISSEGIRDDVTTPVATSETPTTTDSTTDTDTDGPSETTPLETTTPDGAATHRLASLAAVFFVLVNIYIS